MLYVKNGIFRDSKKFLQCEDGRTIFNASPEQWEAEGWKEYVPEPEPVYEKTFEEKQLDLIEDARSFGTSLTDIPYSREERTFYRQLAKDLLEEGLTEAQIFNENDTYYNLEAVVKYFRDLNIFEYECRSILQDHILAIKEIKSGEELDNYDYTLGYPEAPTL